MILRTPDSNFTLGNFMRAHLYSAMAALKVGADLLFDNEKVEISRALFTLFKYKNYRAYHAMQWVNAFAWLGRMSTYLAAITVGSSKNLLLTLPTAVGTVVGNLITTKLSKKYEPTKLLKFCGIYSPVASFVLFGICFLEAKMGIKFFEGWNSIFFYLLQKIIIRFIL